MAKNKKAWVETFPRIDVAVATNEVLVEELMRVSNWVDWATSSAENRHYEEYSGELKAEVLRRMAK